MIYMLNRKHCTYVTYDFPGSTCTPLAVPNNQLAFSDPLLGLRLLLSELQVPNRFSLMLATFAIHDFNIRLYRGRVLVGKWMAYLNAFSISNMEADGPNQPWEIITSTTHLWTYIYMACCLFYIARPTATSWNWLDLFST